MIEFPYMRELVMEYGEMVAKRAKDWAEKEVFPKRREYDEDYDRTLIDPAMEKLFVGMELQKLVWPKDYGGAGLKTPELTSTLVRVLEEVGKAEPGIGFVFACTFSLFTHIALEPHINRELCEEFAPQFCTSRKAKTCSLILPEQGYIFGEEVAKVKGRSVRVKAERRGDKWILNGEALRPVNSGAMADLYGAVCSDGSDIIFAFVPGSANGVKRGEPIIKTGLAADKNADVTFEDVEVPNRYVFEGEVAKRADEITSWLNLSSSALCVGAMMDIYKTLKEWSTTRIIRGKPLKENPVDAIVLADVAQDVTFARLLAYSLANAMSKPDLYGERWSDQMVNMAEMIGIHCANTASKVAGRAMELMASMGYAREGDIEKHWRDVDTMRSALGGSMPILMDVARLYYGCATL
jgi:alkylation response protein AidB-like acyl-CoA dehydrogenase